MAFPAPSPALQALITPQQKRFSIRHVTIVCGVSSRVLRIWEKRYGWPNPARDPQSGYRIFRQWQVDDLIRVVALLKKGWTISELIVDGLPRWPAPDAKPTKPQKGAAIELYHRDATP